MKKQSSKVINKVKAVVKKTKVAKVSPRGNFSRGNFSRGNFFFSWFFSWSFLISLIALFSCGLFAKNGFDLKGSLIPEAQILRGGPPKDGIPAIDNPKFIKARQAYYLKNSDSVIGVKIGKIAKAYPIKILNWHEVVNDKIGSTYFSVTFCPLCGSGVVFNADIKGKKLTFGVSGLLYNSDVLLYDRDSESLWSQLQKRAVTGQYKSTQLKVIPSVRTSWFEWKKKNPNSLVLSRDTSFSRDYDRDPYKGYALEESLYFPVSKKSSAYSNKEMVFVIDFENNKKAYPFSELSKTGSTTIFDTLNGNKIKIIWDQKSQTAEAFFASTGKPVPSYNLFWFAWYAFNSDGKVYKVN